jgi:hypothetical protein
MGLNKDFLLNLAEKDYTGDKYLLVVALIK